MSNRPAHELRIGAIKATIWGHETANGQRYNVVLGRLYKDAEDAWQTSDNLGRDDLLVAAKLLDQAHTWILEHGE